MSILVDTSVWIKYFRSGNNYEKLDFLIDENLVVTNDLILTELVPFLKVRKEKKLIQLLYNINRLQLYIKWEQIIEYQTKCLKSGINGVGIPDLIIAQNVKQNKSKIYSLDNHFKLMEPIIKIQLFA